MNQTYSMFFNLFFAIDKVLNGLTGGDPHHTISYRAAIAAKYGERWGIDLCTLLEYFDSGHCDRALRHEERPSCTEDCIKITS